MTVPLMCLTLASAGGLVLSVALHVGYWLDGSGNELVRRVLSGALVPVILSTVGLMSLHTKQTGARWEFEQLLRGAPRWALPTLLFSWAYAVWSSIVAANALFGVSDPHLLLLASSMFFGIYATVFAINHAAFMRQVGRWKEFENASDRSR